MTTILLVADLDDTLVDTFPLRQLRERRDWKVCVSRLNEAKPFPEIASVLRTLREAGVRVGIVTNSVSYYAGAVLKRFALEHDKLIAWHDTTQHKPHPAPVLEVVKKLGLEEKVFKGFGLGDSSDDHRAYVAAGLVSLGAGWSPALDKRAEWGRILRTPEALLEILTR